MQNAIKVFEDVKRRLAPMSRDELKSVAEDAGCCVGTLENWVNEKTVAPRISTFVNVAKTFGYEVCLKRARKLKLVA